MSEVKNLADPAFEPSDAQLEELSERAFAHVAEAREAAMRELRARIETARAEVLRRLDERAARPAAK